MHSRSRCYFIPLFLMAFSPSSLASAVISASACEQLLNSKDETAHKILEKYAPCPMSTATEDSPQIEPTRVSDSLLMTGYKGWSDAFSASRIGTLMIDNEEYRHCQYVRSLRNPGSAALSVSRFLLPTAAEDQAVEDYVKVLELLSNGISPNVCNQAASDIRRAICLRITEHKTLPQIKQTLMAISQDIKGILRTNDAMAGAAKLTSYNCSDRALKMTNAGARPKNAKDIMEPVLNTTRRHDASVTTIEAAERVRLDRVYLDFMKSRLRALEAQ